MYQDSRTHCTSLDIAGNRIAQKYSRSIIHRRICWAIGSRFLRFSPRPLFAWRRFVLRLFGAKVGREVHIYSSALIYYPWNLDIGDWSSIGEWALIYNLGKVTIGERTTISQRTHLCAGTHDYRDLAMPLLTPPIQIGDDVWVCADAFLGPGVTVGRGAIVGARAVVVKNIEPWTIVAGNPARMVKKRILPEARRRLPTSPSRDL
jgi:putative colanic acid biosynthesis acetyltransferase WcaF